MPPYIGELRLFAGTFAPDGWAFCDGSTLGVAQNNPLYNLLGNTYGGAPGQTFALPDLRGRVVTHQGGGLALGMQGGEEQLPLTTAQIPAHNHTMQGSNNNAATASPQGGVLATLATPDAFAYATRPPNHNLDPSAVTMQGTNAPHPNLQPYLCITWIISLYGIYPSPS